MAFTTMTGSVSNHQAIVGDVPALDATGFKELLDKAAEDIVAFINSTLLVELEENTVGVSAAEKIGSGAISGVTGTTVRDQISSLKAQIAAVALGAIPDGTLTETQMADDMKKDITGGVVSVNTYLSDASFSTRRDINMHTTYIMGGLI